MVDPELYGGAKPLSLGISDQFFWNRIAIHDESIEHDRKVYIRNAPLTAQVFGVANKQGLCS